MLVEVRRAPAAAEAAAAVAAATVAAAPQTPPAPRPTPTSHLRPHNAASAHGWGDRVRARTCGEGSNRLTDLEKTPKMAGGGRRRAATVADGDEDRAAAGAPAEQGAHAQ